MKRILTIMMTIVLLCSPLQINTARADDEPGIDETNQETEVLTEELEEEEGAVIQDETVIQEETETAPEEEELSVIEESTEELPVEVEYFVLEEESENTEEDDNENAGSNDDGFQIPPLTFQGGVIDVEPLKRHVSEQDAEINATIPTSYDLRNYNLVTGVKDQNPYGSCWAFATMASAESGIRKKYGKLIYLAELQLAYYGWNNYGISDWMGMITYGGSRYSTSKSGKTLLDAGGYDFTADLALASGIGFSYDFYYPYNWADEYLNGQYLRNCYSTDFRLRGSKWLPMSDQNTIKNALMNYGAMAVSYYHDDSYYNSTNAAYYQNSNTYSNHAVTLVGWDDNYSRYNFNSVPQGNGAWLIKNSWGTGWGNNGYFWISYYDLSIKNNIARFYDAEVNNSIKANDYHIYQYDGSGNQWANYYYTGDVFYGSNIYTTATEIERLTDIGFFFYGTDIDYTIYIYKNVTDTSNPCSGTKVLTQKGHQTDAGYSLIALNDTIYLSQGENYAVVVKQTSPNKDTLYLLADYTNSWTVNYTDYTDTYRTYNNSSNDLSFYSTDGKTWTNIAAAGYSARIKAHTLDASAERNYVRIYRPSRLDESIITAEELKTALGVSYFDNIIVAKDSDFADALSGSYLAARKNAPILLINDDNYDQAWNYIIENLSYYGTVYILGSESSVSSWFEYGLPVHHNVIRLAGTSRYLTNLEILKEAGMTSSGDIVVVTGTGYADSLSSASTGLPIMMVDKTLKKSQKAFLKANVKGKIYILGQTGSVSSAVEKALKAYGTVKRIGGSSRWITTRLVAEQFFKNPKYVVLATGNDYADGLIASPLAYALKAPLLMCASDKTAQAKTFVADKTVIQAYIVGSKSYISDEAVRKIMLVNESVTILER